MSLSLLFHTLKYLRWEQVVYRPWRIAQNRFYKAFPQIAARWTAQPLPVPEVSTQAVGVIKSVFENSLIHLNTPLDQHDQRLIDLSENRFTFLNKTLTIGLIDWNHRYQSHLWNYHFHYFNFAPWGAQALTQRDDARAWQACRNLIENWIKQARLGLSDGWDAYPTSLRVVNWIYAYVLIADGCQDREFLERWRASIYQQLDFLSGHLEFHLLANHLLKNLKALIVGGLLFDNTKWLKTGERLLWREFDEQVLSDGGHYERAPMYHAQVMADFLESYALLLAFNRMPKSGQIESKLRAMAGFLAAVSYPDNTLALFNDSANAEETRPFAIIATAMRVVGHDKQPQAQAFPKTGYYVWMSADGREKIVVDAGPPSVSYNTAHAHCDLLSYELWLDGKPFIVDSGVHGYGEDQFREYCRSTRAHNTVMFDGREQSEVWGTFRMARRARVLGAEAVGDWDFRGAYHPFYDARLKHERRINRDSNGDWLITDVTLGVNVVRTAESFIHLHPDVSASFVSTQDGSIQCVTGASVVLIEPFGTDCASVIELNEAGYFPDFGIAQASQTIKFTYPVGAGAEFGYRISRCA